MCTFCLNGSIPFFTGLSGVNIPDTGAEGSEGGGVGG